MNAAIEIDYLVAADFSAAGYVPNAQAINRWVECALEFAAYKNPAQVSVCVVDKQEITALNNQYRKKNYATNVLSFPYEPMPGMDVPLLGDIAVCAEVINEEAREQRKTAEQHWAHMIVHGVLHLLGYDHIDDKDAQQMEAMEIRILEQLGFTDPYGEINNL